MFYSVDGALAEVLDESRSVVMRMLKLYELQIAIHFCEGPARLSDVPLHDESARGVKIEVSSDIVQQARMFAIIKMLIAKTGEGDIHRGIRHNDPQYLVRQFHEEGSWPFLLKLPSAEDFDIRVQNKRVDMDRISNVADFSFRANVDPGTSVLGGKTMAYDIIFNPTSELNPGVGSTVVRETMKSLEPVICLALLIYKEKFRMRPPYLHDELFVNSLRHRVHARNVLLELIAKHNFLANYLRKRGYSVSEIVINGGVPSTPVDRPSLGPRTLALVESYGDPSR